MTTILQSRPLVPAYAPAQFPSGILLSPPRLVPAHSTSSVNSESSSSSSASAASSRHSRKPRASSTPRIRFAPLPDPRRAVLVTDDGAEIPLPQDEPSPKRSSWSGVPTTDITTPSSSAPSTASPTPATLSPDASDDDHASTVTPTHNDPAPKRSRAQRLLRPWRRRASASPPVAPAAFARRNFSTEEILTLGTINLFRTASREHDWGLQLGRWASAGSAKKECAGTPLARSQSQGAGERKPGAGGSGGTRMLNGRVYGARRANPFANVPSADPEFVEWGYGGMGSVQSGAGAAVWGRLQSGRDEEDDDGGGMGWVRRRREERERREAEAKAAESTKAAEEKEEHILRAVNVPAPPAMHRRVHSRSGSSFGVYDTVHEGVAVEARSPTPSAEIVADVIAEKPEKDDEEDDEDETDEDENNTDEDDEDEDEDEDDAAARRTALGAGVEKVSTHKAQDG